MERIPKIHGRQTLDQVSAPTLIEAQMPDGGRQTMEFQALLQNRPAILAFLKEINFQGSPLPLLHRIAACDKPMVQDLYNREEVYGLPPFFMGPKGKGCVNAVLLCQLLITNPGALGEVIAQLGR
ncbi:MAG: hypothetical protein LBS22_04105 [Puniceicoccales bacterium]|jgi:hypothetical protein|nr:hypothetical protein [Puniceicoccales bacterium]